MADDPTKHARDNDRIDVSQDHECRDWSQRFDVARKNSSAPFQRLA